MEKRYLVDSSVSSQESSYYKILLVYLELELSDTALYFFIVAPQLMRQQ
jgi:hypothetical protein